MLRIWDELPEYMKTEAVRPYYEYLRKKKASLIMKRCFDIFAALTLLLVLSPLLFIISILIIKDSKGGVFFRQKRVTQYGKIFKIFKFRTMIANADEVGTQVTLQNDARITKIGVKLRKYRIDEIPQLINIILGDMSFVGTRPESVHYVKYYTSEMFATLLLPAGLTSEASIQYKNEAYLLEQATDADRIYLEEILPEKMKYNLNSIQRFSFWKDIGVMFRTIFAMVR